MARDSSAPAAPRHISTPNHPSGIETGVNLPNSPYKNATGAVVHAWRPGHWYTNTFEIGSFSLPQKGNVSAEWELFPGMNNVAGRIDFPTVDKGSVKFIGVFNTTDECWAAVNVSTKGLFKSFTFHTEAFSAPWRMHCYGDTSFTWINRQQAGIDSGKA